MLWITSCEILMLYWGNSQWCREAVRYVVYIVNIKGMDIDYVRRGEKKRLHVVITMCMENMSKKKFLHYYFWIMAYSKPEFKYNTRYNTRREIKMENFIYFVKYIFRHWMKCYGNGYQINGFFKFLLKMLENLHPCSSLE